MKGTSAGNARVDQVFHDLVLPVDRDRSAAREAGHVDVMAFTREGEIDAAMDQSLALESRADADVGHQVDGPLFEHAGANPLDHVIPTPVLEDDRVDTGAMEQVTEHQSGRAGADDSNL